MARQTVAERFAAKLVPGDDGCLLWAGAHDQTRPLIVVDGGNVNARRVAWELSFGPVAAGLRVVAACGNPSCVAAEHLQLAPLNASKRRCPHGHVYSAENVYVDRAGSRHCRACWRRRSRERLARARKTELSPGLREA
jgi:hypothetical protein